MPREVVFMRHKTGVFDQSELPITPVMLRTVAFGCRRMAYRPMVPFVWFQSAVLKSSDDRVRRASYQSSPWTYPRLCGRALLIRRCILLADVFLEETTCFGAFPPRSPDVGPYSLISCAEGRWSSLTCCETIADFGCNSWTMLLYITHGVA